MNIYILPFIASFLFLCLSLFSLYRPGRIQGRYLSLGVFFASVWIFCIGLEYYLYSIGSRNLQLIKWASFIAGLSSHLMVAAVILLSWKFPPIDDKKPIVLYITLGFCAFVGLLSWRGIEMSFEGFGIQRKYNQEIMIFQGIWFVIGSGYGIIHLYYKRFSKVSSRLRGKFK